MARDQLRGKITQRHQRHAAVAATGEMTRPPAVASEPGGKRRLADSCIAPDHEIASFVTGHEPIDGVDQPLTAHELLNADLVEHRCRVEPYVPQPSKFPGEHVTGDDVAAAKGHACIIVRATTSR